MVLVVLVILTPLHTNGQCDVIRLLHEMGADVHRSTNDSLIPMFVAAQKDHCDVIRVFMT